MKLLRRSNYLILFILILGLMLSCEKDDNNAYIFGTNSVVNNLEKDENYSLFLEAIEKANMYSFLDGNSGTYTVLAPDNQAVRDFLNEKQLEDFDQLSEDELFRLVNYHIIDVLTPSKNFITGYTPTLAEVPINDSLQANLSLYVNNTIDELKFNGQVEITEKDIVVDNGMLHKINTVLDPPTLKTFMDADENLKAFYEKITEENIATDFEDLLSNPDLKTTVLVPNQLAVESFFNEQSLSVEELNNLYRYHLLDTLKLIQSLNTGYYSTKASEDYSGQNHALDLYINTQAGLLLNGETSILISDLMTINGNIQVTDKVLNFPTLKTFITADERLMEFYNALSDSLQVDFTTLLEENVNEGNLAPFTVFAPDNEAFDDLIENIFGEDPEDWQDIDPDEMEDILNLHIIPNLSLRKEDFSNQTLQTLGESIQLDADEMQLIDPVQERSPISNGNIQSGNGVLHKIERVLQPY